MSDLTKFADDLDRFAAILDEEWPRDTRFSLNVANALGDLRLLSRRMKEVMPTEPANTTGISVTPPGVESGSGLETEQYFSLDLEPDKPRAPQESECAARKILRSQLDEHPEGCTCKRCVLIVAALAQPCRSAMTRPEAYGKMHELFIEYNLESMTGTPFFWRMVDVMAARRGE